MQKYNQQPQGYQRPGSTTGFAGQPGPPPPPYATYQTASPHAQSQWAPPAQNQAPSQQQWNQPQQASENWGAQQPQQPAGGYNPGTYGAMPGGYGQAQPASTTQLSNPYSLQQQDVPPPPPPKPHGFAGAVQQQQQQNWAQQPAYGTQMQGAANQQGQQGGYPQQQSGYPNQGTPQQPYNTAAPPPPSQTPGGSYFPPSQSRPTADQTATYSTPSSAVAQQPPSSILSPNEQHPAYVPPSLSGQGVTSYMPANTNPLPGVYVPPPPDIPAWQQASHAPLQGGSKKFRYTKPTVDPSFYAQGYQGVQQPQQIPQQSSQPVQNQFQPQGQMQQPGQPQQQQFGQPIQPQGQFQQYAQAPHAPPIQQSDQQFQQQGNQWQPTPPIDQGHAQQQQNPQAPSDAQYPVQRQNWQPGYQAQSSIAGQQYPPGQDQGIQAPTPISSHTGTAPPNFVNTPSPKSQSVSPVYGRHNSMGFSSGQNPPYVGGTGSVSSIALGAIHAQRAGNRTSSPAQTKAPSPPLARDSASASASASAFSALGSGGPSDWEHFGHIEEEVDDEEIFNAKKDEKSSEPASVELPAETPSLPSTQDEWPTPPAQSAPLNVGIQRDTYQPTPPPGSSDIPAQLPPQQGFVVDDATIAPAVTQSPQVGQFSRPPPTQQGFVMSDGGWGTPKQGTSTQQQHHQPPPAGNAIVIDDRGWANSQQTPTQPPSGWGVQAQNQNHAVELHAKDEAYERLKTDTEKEKADLLAEIEGLKAEVESAKSHYVSEKNVLNKQIEAMKVAADQSKSNADALNKEKDSTIERLREDAEGKDDAIKERDATIADLKQQLDAEKTKELPKPTPADLIPDINPWYAGSLERYIGMLRSEANAPQVDDKIQVFTGFLRAESGMRGLEYYSTPPAPLMQEPVAPHHPEEPTVLSRGVSNASIRKQDIHVQVPEQRPDEFQYSPGGRPVLKQPTLQSNEGLPTGQPFSMMPEPQQPHPISTATDLPQRSGSGAAFKPSNTILTPTSSNDDDFSKTPIQSPLEEPLQPQYKAYIPAGVIQSESVQSLHRQSVSFATPPTRVPLHSASSSSNHDEIFFGAHDPQSSSKPTSRPTTNASTLSDVPTPAPLSFASGPSTIAPLAPKKNLLGVLADLLPTRISPSQPNAQLEEIWKKASALPSDFSYITELATTWEKSAILNRKKNDAARHRRQEEAEEQTDQLFNNNEISYADIGDIEDEFKEKERELKAQEDRDEYKSYVENVFDKVYDSLQAEIKSLMDLYIESENLLDTSISGITSLSDPNSAPLTQEALKLLKILHSQIEIRHERVAQAVAERDKRYKKTEIQPLYAAGNIAKMKSVERHFENAEKQAVLRSKGEKAERIGELVRVAEEVVVGAVGREQGEADRILAAIRILGPEEDEGKAEILGRARDTLLAIKTSSKDLLGVFNALEVELNASVLEAEIAQAKAENLDPSKVNELEREMSEGEKKLKEEFERRIAVLEQDKDAVETLLAEKGFKVTLTEEQLKERRMKAALEEAKRRNGEL